MTTVNGKAEIHVFGIDGVDTCVCLSVFLIVGTIHDAFDVGCSVAIVSDIGCNLCTIHSLTPCSPGSIVIAKAANLLEGTVSIDAWAPAPIVSTYHSILFAHISTVEDDYEIVPVSYAIRIVVEVNNFCFLGLYLYNIGMRSPECCGVVLSSQDVRSRNNQCLSEC